MDVLATEAMGAEIVADDFICSSNSAINTIDIWGSWLNDAFDPNAAFQLKIWGDVPETTNAPSHPGQPIASIVFPNPPYAVTLASSNVCVERFLNPNLVRILGIDSSVYRYRFTLPKRMVHGPGQHHLLAVGQRGQHHESIRLEELHYGRPTKDAGVWSFKLAPATNEWLSLSYPSTHSFLPKALAWPSR